MLSRLCARGMQRSGRQGLRMAVFSRLMESQLICGLRVESGVPTVREVEDSWAGGMLEVCLAELGSNFLQVRGRACAVFWCLRGLFCATLFCV